MFYNTLLGDIRKNDGDGSLALVIESTCTALIQYWTGASFQLTHASIYNPRSICNFNHA